MKSSEAVRCSRFYACSHPVGSKNFEHMCQRRIYDSRSQNDVRNHLHHCADDSVRWIFPADLVDEQGQRIHGEPTATEFLPRRPRPRGRYRDLIAGLPDARRRGSSSRTFALVRSNRSATFAILISSGSFSHFCRHCLLKLWLLSSHSS